MDDLLMEKALKGLVEKLRGAHGKNLKSVLLYGSGATGETHGAYSDLNVLAVVEELGVRELEASEGVFQWWREKGNPAPVLMTVDEVKGSADCFPIEFHDIAERKKILYGTDVTEGLALDDRYYRAQVEHEVRAKLLRLRQKAAGVMKNRELLLRLMCDSVSTFCVLGRHALRLAGEPAPWGKRAIVEQMRASFGVRGQALDMLIGLREGTTRARGVDAGVLLAQYLGEIATLAAAVDRLER